MTKLCTFVLVSLGLALRTSSSGEAWRDPSKMVVSNRTLCIDATVFVAKELINAKGKHAFLDYYGDLLTQVSSIFAWHNVRFTVTTNYFWEDENEIPVTNDLTETFHNFGEFVTQGGTGSDVHILFVDINNTDKNLGKAFINGACTTSSYAVTQVGERAHWDPAYAGQIVAHEVGHLFNLFHEEGNSSCHCPWPNNNCVMKPTTYSWNDRLPTSFDSCNARNLISNPKKCLLDCNAARESVAPSVCGNNNVDSGEDCDCSFQEACELTGKTACCDPRTCTFVDSSFDCVEGDCCRECKFKRGDVCRTASGECDLADFCPGNNADCPFDIFKKDGLRCAGGAARCVQGLCRTKNQACADLFPNSNVAHSAECATIAASYAAKNCSGLSSDKLKNMFCGTGEGECGQVYCTGSFSDPYYKFSVGSTTCYTMLDQEDDVEYNKAPLGTTCRNDKICVQTDCEDPSYIDMHCPPCRKYEECSTAEVCAPNDARWFSTYEGAPDLPQ